MESAVLIDNRINTSKTYTDLVPYSGLQVNQFEVNADGNSFPSQIYFNNIVTPGGLSNTLVGRNMRIRYDVTIVTASNLGAPIGLPQVPYGANTPITAALRSMPLMSVSETVQIQLNGSSTSCNPRQFLSATQRFIKKEYLCHEGLEAPVMADNRTLLLADPVSYAGAVLQPVSGQPLSRAGNSSGDTRASFLPKSYVNAANVSTWVFEVSEPLLISPLTLNSQDVFLGNLDTFSCQINYSSLLDMVVSSVAYDALTSVVITNPRLQLCYITIDQHIKSIPQTLKYNYQNTVYFPKTQAWTPGAGTNGVCTMNSDLVRLQTMPQMIYVFARNPIQTRAGQTAADCFYSIGNASGNAGISVQIGTRTGLLASESAKTCFRTAVSNGYNSTYQDYRYGSGSILALCPSKDLGLSASEVPGLVSGNVNFQIQVSFNADNFAYAGNIAAVPANVELMIVVVYQGDMTVHKGLPALFNLGTLTPSDVDRIFKTGSQINSEAVQSTFAKGAGLYSHGQSIAGHGD